MDRFGISIQQCVGSKLVSRIGTTGVIRDSYEDVKVG